MLRLTLYPINQFIMKLTIKTILYGLLALLIVLIVGGIILAEKKLIKTEENIFGFFSSYQRGHELSSDLVRNKEVIDAELAMLKLIPLPEEKRELKGRIDNKIEESYQHLDTLFKSEKSAENKLLLRHIKLAFTYYARKINQVYLYLYYAQTSTGKPDPGYTGSNDVSKLFSAMEDASVMLTTILGQLYKAAIELPQLEAREKGSLLVARDDESGFLFWWYNVAENTDIEDEAAWMRANPASWVTADVLRQQLESPSMDVNSFLRLHCNVWTVTRTAWLPTGCWDGMLDATATPEPGQTIYVGVDVGLVHDCTAVSIAWVRDNTVCVQSHVFSAVADVPAHEYYDTGRIDLEDVENYIRELAEKYHVAELVFDPRFFERSAQSLSGEGLTVAPLHQSSAAMSDAYQEFYASAREGRIRHDGDPVLSEHVAATAAKQTPRGWKISKIDQSKRIDACVATVMAHWRAWRSVAEGGDEGFLL